MQISKTRLHRVNMGVGTYEYVEISATASADTDNFDSEDDAVLEVNDVLDALIQPDLDEAATNVVEGESTHAETWRR